jgi:hypothetical protein
VGAAACEVAGTLIEGSRRRRDRNTWLRSMQSLRRRGTAGSAVGSSDPISLADYRDRALTAARSIPLGAQAA